MNKKNMSEEEICIKCKSIIYREDKTCMNCLIKETKEFIKSMDEKIEQVTQLVEGR